MYYFIQSINQSTSLYYVPLSCQDAGFLHQTAMNLMDIIPSFQTRLLQRSAVWVY